MSQWGTFKYVWNFHVTTVILRIRSSSNLSIAGVCRISLLSLAVFLPLCGHGITLNELVIQEKNVENTINLC